MICVLKRSSYLLMWRRPKRYRKTGQNADLVGSARYNTGLGCHVTGGGNWKELDLR